MQAFRATVWHMRRCDLRPGGGEGRTASRGNGGPSNEDGRAGEASSGAAASYGGGVWAPPAAMLGLFSFSFSALPRVCVCVCLWYLPAQVPEQGKVMQSQRPDVQPGADLVCLCPSAGVHVLPALHMLPN